MLSREELFEKFLAYLQVEQLPPDYLGAEPENSTDFDFYQMVGEWIALRHEVKQQGKLLLSAQDVLQQALASTQSEKEELQLRLEENQKNALTQCAAELSTQKRQFERTHEGLLKDLLRTVDALDHACAHGQAPEAIAPRIPNPPKTIWQKLSSWFTRPSQRQSQSQPEPSALALTEALESNRQGIALIRRSLLKVLRQQQVVPLEAQGQPFDPKRMYAVGRQETEAIPENTVYQEVVRGYLWRDQVLREAQVIVAVQPKTSP